MYIEAIIKEKKRLLAKGIPADQMCIKLKRHVAEWLAIEKLANWQSDLPLLGTRAEVDDKLRNDFTIVLSKPNP